MKMKISVMVIVVLTIALIGCSHRDVSEFLHSPGRAAEETPGFTAYEAKQERIKEFRKWQAKQKSDWRCSVEGIYYAMEKSDPSFFYEYSSQDIRFFILAGGCDSLLGAGLAAEIKATLMDFERQYKRDDF